MSHHVFVFGTLKEGFPNFATNHGQRVPGEFVTSERFPFHLVGERFVPWLMNSPGQGERIVGQVFEVDAAALEAMDRLERIHEPDGYQRLLLQVESRAAPLQRLSAFAYLKRAEHFDPSDARSGPFAEYTLAHAAMYRRREVSAG
jgi:gamma-glutamylaminecyclotransferase